MPKAENNTKISSKDMADAIHNAFYKLEELEISLAGIKKEFIDIMDECRTEVPNLHIADYPGEFSICVGNVIIGSISKNGVISLYKNCVRVEKEGVGSYNYTITKR